MSVTKEQLDEIIKRHERVFSVSAAEAYRQVEAASKTFGCEAAQHIADRAAEIGAAARREQSVSHSRMGPSGERARRREPDTAAHHDDLRELWRVVPMVLVDGCNPVMRLHRRRGTGTEASRV